MLGEAFYLKYRPQRIAELDLVSVRRELSTILSSGRFAHAYLFVGPRGTGKTSAARILAKVVNCVRNEKALEKGKKKLSEPCNRCSMCTEITAGSALDLVEIDAASNRGIDDIRELRERIKLAPVRAKRKVYIIDEVHMLTKEAFNALLKTLEEPPAHALFVLCTTEPERIPETVASRCTKISFVKASEEEVVRSLMKVVKGEKLKLDDGVLETIAQSVDGSFRDGMKILEQLSLRSASGKGRTRKIQIEDAREVLGLSGELPRKFVEALVAGDKRKVFEFVFSLKKEGKSVDHFLRQVLELLRVQMLGRLGVMEVEPIEGLELVAIKKLIALLSKAASDMRTAILIELPLELAAAEWLISNEEVVVGGESKMSLADKVGVSKKLRDFREYGDKDNAHKKTESKEKNLKKISTKTPTSRVKSGVKSNISMGDIEKSWPRILEHLRPLNHSVEALLKAAQPTRIDGDYLVIEVFYKFHKEQLEVDRYKRMVQGAVSQLVAEGLKLRYVLSERTRNVAKTVEKEHENVSGAVEDEEIVKAAEEIFGS